MSRSALCRCLVHFGLSMFITGINAFTLPKGETRLKRCMSGPHGICVIGWDLSHCDHPNCIHGGGCVGWMGACAGICYCYGSGYEYRCRLSFCDVVG